MSGQLSVVSGQSLPPVSENQDMIRKFRRVKGSGTFFLDEFCLVTGLAEEPAKDCLAKAESTGEVTVLDGIYILKPLQRKKQRRRCNDLHFSVKQQQDIYAACGVPSSRGYGPTAVTCGEILQRVPMGASTLKSYLRAMEEAGILVCHVRKNEKRKYYSQGHRRWLEGSYWEFWKNQNQIKEN